MKKWNSIACCVLLISLSATPILTSCSKGSSTTSSRNLVLNANNVSEVIPRGASAESVMLMLGEPSAQITNANSQVEMFYLFPFAGKPRIKIEVKGLNIILDASNRVLKCKTAS